jgi:DNA-binding NtrC family response regulator
MRTLIAEDEPDICTTYKIALESRNHEVIIVRDGNECFDLYKKEFLDTQRNQNYYHHKSEYNNYNKGANNNKNTLTFSNNSSSISHHRYYSPFDAVVLDYRIPGKDGLQIAKEILELNPEQRIIFASAYVKETLEDSVKELKRVVELMQKPFDADVLVDTIEDKEAQEGVKILMRNLAHMNKATGNHNDIDDLGHNEDKFEPSFEQLRDLFEGLRRIQKGRTF